MAAQARSTFQLSDDASLYVCNLSHDVTEAMLKEKFSAAGPVVSVCVCRDVVTHHSLSFAFIVFQKPDDAKRALDTLSHEMIKNYPMRIMWSRKDPSVLLSVIVENLDKSIDEDTLYNRFCGFGNILSCQVVKDAFDGSGDYGYILYETEEAANRAIAEANGTVLSSRKVYVSHYMNQKERLELIEEEKTFTNVFVNNLPTDFDNERLCQIFAAFGSILSLKATSDTIRSFGFVNFETHEAAAMAVEEMNGKELNGRTLYVTRAQKRSERQQQTKKHVNLYVKNLDDSVDDEKLRTEFAPFGAITSAKVMTNERGNSRGFGFVCFSSSEEATKALIAMNGRIIATKPLYVSLAQAKEERRAKLTAQYEQRVNQPHRTPQSGQQPASSFIQPAFPTGFQQLGGPTFRGWMQPSPVFPSYVTPYHNQLTQRAAESSLYSQGVRFPGVPYYVQARQPTAHPYSLSVGHMASGRPGNQRGNWQQRVVTVGNQPPLTAKLSAAANLQDQKQMIGEKLFSIIRADSPELAGKITGMLLELDNFDLLHLLENPDLLQRKVEEAAGVLKAHQEREQTAKSVKANSPTTVDIEPSRSVSGNETLQQLTPEPLAASNAQDQKQLLGERLFSLIQIDFPELAGKITGMLLEIDHSDLLHIMENSALLESKVEEAVGVLKAHQEGEQQSRSEKAPGPIEPSDSVSENTVAKEKLKSLEHYLCSLEIPSEDVKIDTERKLSNIDVGQWCGNLVGVHNLHDPSTRSKGVANQLRFEQEVKILCLIRHPNLISVWGFTMKSGVPFKFVTELLEGTLREVISTGSLTFREKIDLAIGSAAGISYLHQLKPQAVVHGNVSSLTILVSESMTARIGDLGSAQFVDSPLSSKQTISSYAAPEFLKSTQAADVYSLGITVIELMIQEDPPSSGSRHDARILKIPHRVVQGICRKMVQHDPGRRLSSVECRRSFETVRHVNEYTSCSPRRRIQGKVRGEDRMTFLV